LHSNLQYLGQTGSRLALCRLGAARAQARFDKAAATLNYQKLLEIWKNADADFIPDQEARRELAALNPQAKD
jgi:hypothetical protein